MARMGELKRAAPQLGVISTVLRQQGWKTASPERIKAVADNPPAWLVTARERRSTKRARQQRLGDRRNMAARLGIGARTVIEHDISPADVEGLLAAPPDWLIAAQQRQQAHVERAAQAELRRALTDVLVTSVHDVWFQELKRATTDEEVEAIDARWAPEVGRAKDEAHRLVDELSPEQVHARIDRERQATSAAGVYRATQLVRRALGSTDG